MYYEYICMKREEREGNDVSTHSRPIIRANTKSKSTSTSRDRSDQEQEQYHAEYQQHIENKTNANGSPLKVGSESQGAGS